RPRNCYTSASGSRWRESGGATTRTPSRTRSSCGAGREHHQGARLILKPLVRCVLSAHRWTRRWCINADSSDLKEVLMRTDTEFHTLAERHHQLEDRLNELTARHYLSEPEQLEEVTLKKRKLQLKDRMEDILRGHPQETARG